MPQRPDEMSMTVKRTTSAKLDELVELCRARNGIIPTYRYVVLDQAIEAQLNRVKKRLQQNKAVTQRGVTQ